MSNSNFTREAPDTLQALHPLILKRWSPRSFSDRPVSKDQMDELFEAARWAASSNNEQPWSYTYAFRGSPGFDSLWECLAPGNQPWTSSAAVLMVAMYRTQFQKSGKSNPWAAHDLGLANAQLILQAAHRDIYGHMMAGFDTEKVKSLLSLEDNIRPACLIALGYLGDPESLNEPYKSRELAPRSRHPIQEFTREL